MISCRATLFSIRVGQCLAKERQHALRLRAELFQGVEDRLAKLLVGGVEALDEDRQRLLILWINLDQGQGGESTHLAVAVLQETDKTGSGRFRVRADVGQRQRGLPAREPG